MSEDNRFQRAVEELADAICSVENAAREKLTKEQLADALKQAIACGDFLRMVEVMTGRQQVTYIPYRREQELTVEIARLKASFQLSGEARTGWLNEFDGYKLQILNLTQRLTQARALIELIDDDGRNDSNWKRTANIWLEKIP